MLILNYRKIADYLKTVHADVSCNLAANGFDFLCRADYSKGDEPKSSCKDLAKINSFSGGLMVYVVDYNHWIVSYFYNPDPTGRLGLNYSLKQTNINESKQ